jgi:sec-independent protein translocase protein TatC
MAEAQYKSPSEHDDEPRSGQMGFLAHLDELRTRIVRSLLAIGAGMLVAFLFYERLGDFVLGPTLRVLPPGTELIFVRPGEAFAFYLDVSLIGGVVLAAPFVAYQVWRFVAPGLYTNEKRLVVPFVVLASLGTLAGAAFSHYVMFPSMMSFFGQFGSPKMKFMPRVEDTFELYKNLLLGMVVVFQIPTIVLFLAKMRLVTAGFLWRHIKYAILVIFILAAVLTPSPDPWNQTAFALPMVALYVIGIGVAWIVQPKGRARNSGGDATQLRLVVGAMVVDRAMRQSNRGTYQRRRMS